MLQVSLLGSFGISIDGRRIHSDLGPSGQRMAAFLFAFPGRLHRRERIADLFWPDMGTDRSRAALNSALWRLRKILCKEPNSNGGKNLRSIGDDVVLEPQPWLTVDANIIASLARKVKDREESEAVAAGSIKNVIELYQGPLLEAEEDEFFIEERERIHTCFVSLAHYALARYRENRAYGDAITICRKVLVFDPFREYFVRNLLGLLCLNEQRAEAARFFERWQKLLQAEIGVGPMPQTTALMQLVRKCDSSEDIEEIWRRLCVEHQTD